MYVLPVLSLRVTDAITLLAVSQNCIPSKIMMTSVRLFLSPQARRSDVCACSLRYRKLSEAAKDVDNFTRFVIEKYAELRRHVQLNHDDGDVECDRRHSICDHDFLSRHEPMSSVNDDLSLDSIHGTRRSISSSPQQPPSTDS